MSSNLYKNISFENIFKTNLTVHANCVNNLVFNSNRLAFPINDNIIYYEYLFDDLNKNFNIEYLEAKYMGELVIRNSEKRDWSIVIFYECGLFDSFSSDDLLILFSLSNSPFLIVSLIFHDFSRIFSEKM